MGRPMARGNADRSTIRCDFVPVERTNQVDHAKVMETMWLLVEAGADLEAKGPCPSDRTALYLAAEMAWTTAPVEWLIAAGAKAGSGTSRWPTRSRIHRSIEWSVPPSRASDSWPTPPTQLPGPRYRRRPCPGLCPNSHRGPRRTSPQCTRRARECPPTAALRRKRHRLHTRHAHVNTPAPESLSAMVGPSCWAS